jgi:hypothetical protein
VFNRNAGQAGFEQRTGRELNGMLLVCRNAVYRFCFRRCSGWGEPSSRRSAHCSVEGTL